MNTEKNIFIITEHIKMLFDNINILESAPEYIVYHNSSNNVIREIIRYCKRKGFEVDKKDMFDKLEYKDNMKSDKSYKWKNAITTNIAKNLGIVGLGKNEVDLLAGALKFTKNEKKNASISLYKNGVVQSEKCNVKIVFTGSRFELSMDIN